MKVPQTGPLLQLLVICLVESSRSQCWKSLGTSSRFLGGCFLGSQSPASCLFLVAVGRKGAVAGMCLSSQDDPCLAN